ncbi:MAG: hypothetical protein KatS3mg111_3089 [Pirellulaceae bacterium]|nr:MAG: hypothetical protein KatS3mg111_3089 [Pirellulaceae bacterium]
MPSIKTDINLDLEELLCTVVHWQRGDATSSDLQRAVRRWVKSVTSEEEWDRLEDIDRQPGALISTIVRRSLEKLPPAAALMDRNNGGAPPARPLQQASLPPTTLETVEFSPAGESRSTHHAAEDPVEEIASRLGADWWCWYYYMDERIYSATRGMLTIGRIAAVGIVILVVALVLIFRPPPREALVGNGSVQPSTAAAAVPKIKVVADDGVLPGEPPAENRAEEAGPAAADTASGSSASVIPKGDQPVKPVRGGTTRPMETPANYQPRTLPDFSSTGRRASITQIVELLDRQQWDRALEALQPWVDDAHSTFHRDALLLQVVALMEQNDGESRYTAGTRLAAIPSSECDSLCHLLTAYWLLRSSPAEMARVVEEASPDAPLRGEVTSWARLGDADQLGKLETELAAALGEDEQTLAKLLLLAAIHERAGQAEVAELELMELRRRIAQLVVDGQSEADQWIASHLRTRLLTMIDSQLAHLYDRH